MELSRTNSSTAALIPAMPLFLSWSAESAVSRSYRSSKKEQVSISYLSQETITIVIFSLVLYFTFSNSSVTKSDPCRTRSSPPLLVTGKHIHCRMPKGFEKEYSTGLLMSA